MSIILLQKKCLDVSLQGFCILLALLSIAGIASAQTAPTTAVLFRDVRIFTGSDKLSGLSNVLVVGNQISKISSGPVTAPPGTTVTEIEGGGRTLMPGMIDAHVHMMLSSISQLALLTTDIGFVNLASGRAATGMLLRGYTTVRDLGGPSFGLKKAIDADILPGPRIYPSGAMISQSGGAW